MIENILFYLSQIPWGVCLILSFFLALVIIYAIRQGVVVNLKDKKVMFFSGRYNEARCKLCEEEISRIIRDVATSTFQISNEKERCRQNLEDLILIKIDLIESKMAEFFNEILNEELNKRNITDSEKRLNLLNINMQLLNLIWLVRKSEVFSLVRQSMIQNNFSHMESVNLRAFSTSKLQFFMAKIEKSKIFPDFSNDPNFIINREILINYLRERMMPIITDATHDIFSQAQQIRRNSEKVIEQITLEINNSSERFKESRNKILEAIEK